MKGESKQRIDKRRKSTELKFDYWQDRLMNVDEVGEDSSNYEDASK